MKRLDSILVRIHADKDIMMFNKEQNIHDIIGLRHTGGEIIAGIYHKETNEWKSTPLPASCQIISRQVDNTTHLHIVFSGALPRETYLAVEQPGNENIVAITPLIGPENADLKNLETYFFRNE